MENLGYYNGRYDLIENMMIPMNDRACFFGDGLYEAAYARNYVIYALDEHIDRLFDSADELGIIVPHTKSELKDLIYSLVKKLDCGEQLVYFQVSRGTEMRKHAPSDGLVGNVWIIIRPGSIKDVYTKIKLITYPDTRYFHCNMKTLNLLPSVLASRAAEAAGADEAVFHRGDTVTECAHSNIAIIRDNRVVQTAPVENMILPGVARAHFIDACREFGFEVREEYFSLEDMRSAAEVIVLASGSLCRSAYEIDGIPVGGRAPEMLKQLQDKLLSDFLSFTEVK
jgi:D-alanine transaminase